MRAVRCQGAERLRVAKPVIVPVAIIGGVDEPHCQLSVGGEIH